MSRIDYEILIDPADETEFVRLRFRDVHGLRKTIDLDYGMVVDLGLALHTVDSEMTEREMRGV